MKIVAIQCRTNTGEIAEVPVSEMLSVFSGGGTSLTAGTVPKSDGGKYIASGISVDDSGQIKFDRYGSDKSFTGLAVGIIGFTNTGQLVTLPIQQTTSNGRVSSAEQNSLTTASTENLLPYFSDALGSLADTDILNDNNRYSFGGQQAFWKIDVYSESVNISQSSDTAAAESNGYRLNGKLVVSFNPVSGELTIGNTVYTTTNIQHLKSHSVSFNTTPTGTVMGPGVLRWNDTDGTLEFGMKGGNVVQQIGQELPTLVKHADNTGLTNGTVVYVVGSDGSNKTVRYAKADTEATSSKTFGVMTESATGGAKAFCTTFGLVRDIDTSALTEGSAVYLSPSVAGGMTSTKPSAPNHMVLIGFCIRSHATNGSIFVKIINGFEINEIHDISIGTLANNNLLAYESATSIWKNKTFAELGIFSTPTGLTTNYVPKWNGTTLVNSLAFDNGTNFTIGTDTGIDTYSRLYIFGGTNGANVDARPGGGGYDQSIFDAQGSDYATSFFSAHLRFQGTGAVGTTLGYSNVNLADLTYNYSGSDRAFLIRSVGQSPLVFSVNAAIQGKFDTNGLTLNTLSAESTDVDKFLVSNAGLVKYRTGTQLLSDIGAFAAPSGLTTNYVTKWDGTALVNSQIFDSGTFVGFGTATPATLVDVRGQISVNAGSLANPALAKVGDLDTGVYFPADDTLALVTGGTERLRITSVGDVIIGSAAGTNSLIVSKNITGGTTASGIRSSGQIQSDVTTEAYLFRSVMNQANFALPTLIGYESSIGTISGTGTTLINFRAGSTSAGYTNVYGFQSTIASGTNRYGAYFNGTAQNHFRGNVGIGTASTVPATELEVRGVISTALGSASLPSYSFVGDLNTGIYSPSADAMALVTGGVNRVHLNSTGSVGIGTTSLTGYNLRVSKNITGAVGTIAVASDGVIQSDVTSSSVGFQSTIQTQATSFTLANYAHFQAVEGTIGAGSVIGTQTGYRVGSLANGTTIYGFRATIAAASNRWNLHLDGTAQNHIRGNLGIGSGSTAPAHELVVAGITQTTNLKITASATVGKYWVCTNADGTGAWTSLGSTGYLGTWNPSTNTPTIANGTGTSGTFYIATASGTWNSITFAVNDQVWYNGSIWEKVTVGTTIPIATASVLGGIKVGTGLAVDAGTGVASITFGTSSTTAAVGNHTHAFSEITSMPTTIAGYGITIVSGDIPTLNQNTTGSAATLTTIRNIAATGDIAWNVDFNGSAAVSAAATLATVNANIGTFNNVTVNAKGLVTAASNVSYLTANQTITLSGDVSGSGTTTITATLANSGVTAGTYTKITVDAKGRATSGTTLSASDIPSLDFATKISGKPTTLSGYGITDAWTKTESDGRYIDFTTIQSGITGKKTFENIEVAGINFIKDQIGGGTHDIWTLYNYHESGAQKQLFLANETTGNYLFTLFDTGIVQLYNCVVGSPFYGNVSNLLRVDSSIEYSGSLKPLNQTPTAGYFLKAPTSTTNQWAAITTTDISNLSSYTGFDARYYTETESDARYIQIGTTVNLATGVTGVLPIANGGTGSSTRNFVDFVTSESVGGNKTFTGTTYFGPNSGLNLTNTPFGASISGTYGLWTNYNTVGIHKFQVSGGDRIGIFDQGLLIKSGSITSVSPPTERLQVDGNIRYNNLLKPNNVAGTNKQVFSTTGTQDQWVTLDTTYISNIDSWLATNTNIGLTNLNDVTITAASLNNVLYHNGTEWINSSADTANLVDKSSAQTISGNKTFSGITTFSSQARFSGTYGIRISGNNTYNGETGIVNNIFSGDQSVGAYVPAHYKASKFMFTHGFVKMGGTSSIDFGVNWPTERLDIDGNFKYSGSLMPSGQTPTAGYFLKTGVTTNMWAPILTSDVTGLDSALARKQDELGSGVGIHSSNGTSMSYIEGTNGQALVKDNAGVYNFMNLEVKPPFLTHKRIAVGTEFDNLSEVNNLTFEANRMLRVSSYANQSSSVNLGITANDADGILEYMGLGDLWLKSQRDIYIDNFKDGGDRFLKITNTGKMYASISGGSGGSATLTANHIGFGDSGNTLTGSSNFIWSDGRFVRIQDKTNSSRFMGFGYNAGATEAVFTSEATSGSPLGLSIYSPSIKFSALSSGSTQMVVANSAGVLSLQAIPSGGGGVGTIDQVLFAGNTAYNKTLTFENSSAYYFNFKDNSGNQVGAISGDASVVPYLNIVSRAGYDLELSAGENLRLLGDTINLGYSNTNKNINIQGSNFNFNQDSQNDGTGQNPNKWGSGFNQSAPVVGDRIALYYDGTRWVPSHLHTRVIGGYTCLTID